MATTAGVWALWADFEQATVDKAIDQWIKRLRAFMKAKGEHFEHLLWLAVAYCVLLDALFQTRYKCLSYFRQHSIFRMTCDRQHKRADSDIMSAGSLLYTCYGQLQYYVNI